MNSHVNRLSVVISPRSEHVVALALAGAPVGLDLDSLHLKGQEINLSISLPVKV